MVIKYKLKGDVNSVLSFGTHNVNDIQIMINGQIVLILNDVLLEKLTIEEDNNV